ncbi:snaclec coagulation factor IX-binding protein subunit A-like [Pantherophis guttatus]|uniref:Snaclec coagulation factor IX-binding protein subunit A-like n=1 Tax=Pantherophis guttatus TaxID=94885 RepID=A0ABM3Z8E5_PANGU|nr:snaclec coagulation factor IX-binding protein subunit A-like [Pantherophis guttatus]
MPSGMDDLRIESSKRNGRGKQQRSRQGRSPLDRRNTARSDSPQRGCRSLGERGHLASILDAGETKDVAVYITSSPNKDLGPMEALSTFRLFLGGFLLAVSLPAGAEALECPGGWRQLKGYCYGFFNLKVTWMRAELECQSLMLNSHLASIVRAEEAELLAKYLDETYTQQSSVWIGMYENKIGTPEKRYFEWTDGTSVDYTSWAPGEPHHLKKHCAVLGKPDYKLWVTRWCNNYLPYLCKFEI